MKSIPPSDKNLLRKSLLQKRAHLGSDERQLASFQIYHHALKWEVFQTSHTIHIYLNQPEEVATSGWIESAWAQQKKVVVPYLRPSSKTMGHSQLDSFQQLQNGPFSIPEPHPKYRVDVDLKTVDLVVVPGVGFDRKGGRLGYGQGYYDRFLSQVQALRVGLAFECQIVDQVPQTEHDVRMHFLISETGVHQVGRSIC